MTWRERQALPGPQKRWFFASVVPVFVDAETGAKIEGLPAPEQKWRFAWPRKGQTYVKYDRPRREARAERARRKDFPLVDDPVAA